jgi:hypothetical protein
MVGDAHITEAPAVDTGTRRPLELPKRLKAAAPTAGAIGVIAAIIGGTMISTSPDGGQTTSVTPEAASAPPPAGPSMPGVAFDQTPGAGSSVQRNVELVVKLKDDSKIKDIIEAFWRDPAAARSRFDTWSANRAEFAGLRLDRVTYSNELVLVLKDGGAPAERTAAIRDAVKKLGAAPDISYAEQQAALAQPGGQ